MLCSNFQKGLSLSLCTDPDGALYIGSVDATGLKALFTDLATERRTIVDVIADGEEWYVEAPDFFVEGHTYSVQLVTQLIVPIDFYPYTFDGTDFVVSDTLTGGVTFAVVKVYDTAGDSYVGLDQHISV